MSELAKGISWPREEMKTAIAGLTRYVVCSRVALRQPSETPMIWEKRRRPKLSF
jgi:hypothetical protein